jgi:hypothetical protein
MAINPSVNRTAFSFSKEELVMFLAELRRQVADFPRQQSGFEPRSSHVGSLVDRVALGLLRFPCHSFIPLIDPHSQPSIFQGWYKRPVSGLTKLHFIPTDYVPQWTCYSVLLISNKNAHFMRENLIDHPLRIKKDISTVILLYLGYGVRFINISKVGVDSVMAVGN